MNLDIDDLVRSLKYDTDFDEVPVPLEVFATSEDYLGLPPLSDYQIKMIEAATQIYREETLIALYGEKEGKNRFKQTFNELIYLLGKGCISYDDEVYDANTGLWNKIGELQDQYDNASCASISQGSQIGSEYRTESWVEGTGRMLKVTTQLGHTITVNPGHKFLAHRKQRFYKRNERDYKASYLELNELNVGDRIATALNLPVNNEVPMDIREVELLGFWLGDGSMPSDNSPCINIDFGEHETKSIARYVEICESLGDVPTVTKHPKKRMVFIRHSRNSPLIDIVKNYNLWGKRAHNKSIPDEIFALPRDQLAVFISRLHGTDGCVYIKNNDGKTQPSIEYCSISKDLAIGYQRLLARLGVPSSIRSRVPKYTYKGERLSGQLAYYVTIGNREGFLAFAKTITMLDKQDKVNEGIDNYLARNGRAYGRIENDVYWDKITKIEEIASSEFYTLTAVENHNYIANMIVNGNSGKDHSSTIACAYVVYLLLCLKDPSAYYGKPSGDAIDIINIAINAQQARTVFFKGFCSKIERSPWFRGRFDKKADVIEFDKHVTVYSGHSEREAWEGLNLIMAVLDEISGFSIENTSGNTNAKTADEIYRMFSASVTSRFSEFGKVLLLSFPRYKGDFLYNRYYSVIAEKDTINRTHVFKLDEELPDGIDSNEFTIEWDEDRISKYNIPRVFALKRPTWEINPTVPINSLKNAFISNTKDSLSRFACMPPDAIDSYFGSRDKIEHAFRYERIMVDEQGNFDSGFKPDPEATYYMHVDLAQVHDRCAVAMSHVTGWQEIKATDSQYFTNPKIEVDFVRYWTPTKDNTIDLSEVKQFILQVVSMGFNVGIVTFDRWGSVDMIKELNNMGIRAENLSLAKKHYDDMKLAIFEERITGPKLPILIDELVKLRVTKNNKVDHPQGGHNDLSEAVCGSIYNTTAYSSRYGDESVEVVTLSDLRVKETNKNRSSRPGETTVPPKMPEDIKEFIMNLKII